MTLRQPKTSRRRPGPRTPAQETAFRVFRLRGLYWMLHALTGARLQAAKHLVDAELITLGVETETDRHQRRTRDLDARLAASEADRAAMFEDLPF